MVCYSAMYHHNTNGFAHNSVVSLPSYHRTKTTHMPCGYGEETFSERDV